MSQTATLRTQDGTNAQTVQTVELPTQAVRTTSGEIAEVPHNRYSLFDTRPLDKVTVDLFQPSPSGERTLNNYDQMPPNAAEDTFIVGLGVSLTKAILKGAADVDAVEFINRIQGGIIQIIRADTQAVLVEEPAQRYIDLSGLQLQGDNVVLPTVAKPVPLDEAVVIPRGIGYRIRFVMGAGAALPSAAQWNASNGSTPSIRVTANHRGNNGR